MEPKNPLESLMVFIDFIDRRARWAEQSNDMTEEDREGLFKVKKRKKFTNRQISAIQYQRKFLNEVLEKIRPKLAELSNDLQNSLCEDIRTLLLRTLLLQELTGVNQGLVQDSPESGRNSLEPLNKIKDEVSEEIIESIWKKNPTLIDNANGTAELAKDRINKAVDKRWRAYVEDHPDFGHHQTKTEVGASAIRQRIKGMKKKKDRP